MRAVAIDAFSAPPSLRDLPVPQPGAREILVHVYAAGVNPYDWKIRDGVLKDALPHEFPLILGLDGAGVVEQVGPGVTEFRVGDAIFGLFWPPVLHYGTYADYLVAPAAGAIVVNPAAGTAGTAGAGGGGMAFEWRYATAGAILAKPAALDFIQAAALPQPAMMALVSLDAARITPRSTVLIVGATGGIGSYAVQLATLRDARVIATARPADAAYITGLGAAEAIDYTRGDLVAAVRALHPGGIDAVIDVVSDPASLEHISHVLGPGGRLVSTVYAADPQTMAKRSIQATNVILQPNADLLRRVAQVVDAGQLKVRIDRTYPLEQAVEALEHSEHGHVRGKVVLTMR